MARQLGQLTARNHSSVRPTAPHTACPPSTLCTVITSCPTVPGVQSWSCLLVASGALVGVAIALGSLIAGHTGVIGNDTAKGVMRSPAGVA